MLDKDKNENSELRQSLNSGSFFKVDIQFSKKLPYCK